MSNPDQPVRSCRVRDLGLGGVFVVANAELRPGDRYSLELSPQLSVSRRRIRASGLIVRVEPGRGAAIEFTDMSVQSFDALDRLVNRSAGRRERSEMLRLGPRHTPRFR